MSDSVHVAVAVIRNDNGQVFITRRAEHVHQGGLWEFPGGKVETGESVEEALQREILEENGILINESAPLIRIPYKYPDKQVLLDVREVINYSGKAHGREGQASQWIDIDELRSVDFPAANRGIVSALLLPSTFLVTPEPPINTHNFLQTLGQRLTHGRRWLQLRAKHLSEDDYAVLAAQVCQMSKRYKAKVMLTTNVEAVKAMSAAGLHVTAESLMNTQQRPVGPDKWFSASCHSESEIEHANSLNVDFIFVGSVKATRSHPEGQPIGWDEFARLAEIANMPVYAIGGMSIDDVRRSRELGGQGVAAISALWNQG